VIAGESLGAHAVIETHTPILYLHVRLEPGRASSSRCRKASTASHTWYGARGDSATPGRRVRGGQLVLFDAEGDR
jgi:hypothetical protein